MGAALALMLALPALAQDEEPAKDVYHDNVVIVLDASGSMAGSMGKTSKMLAAKLALRKVLANVPPNTHVGLLVFGSKNLRSHWAYRLGPVDKGKLMAAINLPKPDGGTPLGAYIKIGADTLMQARNKQFGYGTYRLLVVTDGEASDENKMKRFAPMILARGIVMDVIGVKMKGDHTLAKLAHSYRRANDSRSLRKAVAQVFAEVGGGTDTATAAAFEEIDGLPMEVALGAIEALSETANHPIGTQPPKPAPPPAPAKPASKPGAPAAPATPAAPAKKAEPKGCGCRAGEGEPSAAWAMVLLLIGLRRRRG